MSTRPRALAAACLAAFTIACGSSPTSPSPGGSEVTTIVINGQNGAQAFSPNPASPASRQVVFKNNDTAVHRIVLNDNSADTGEVAPGATSHAISIPAGGASFHCAIHPAMVGAFTPASGDAPPR